MWMIETGKDDDIQAIGAITKRESGSIYVYGYKASERDPNNFGRWGGTTSYIFELQVAPAPDYIERIAGYRIEFDTDNPKFVSDLGMNVNNEISGDVLRILPYN